MLWGLGRGGQAHAAAEDFGREVRLETILKRFTPAQRTVAIVVVGAIGAQA
ncbi:MAG: hypothetical protein M0015_07025 [Betaproteobacteria bacterium]|nr:hypothetical protein [Betaproteobacteria bacterium]